MHECPSRRRQLVLRCCCYNFHRFYENYMLKGIRTCAKQKSSALYSLNRLKEVLYIYIFPLIEL
jgi:hypothetical protein